MGQQRFGSLEIGGLRGGAARSIRRRSEELAPAMVAGHMVTEQVRQDAQGPPTSWAPLNKKETLIPTSRAPRGRGARDLAASGRGGRAAVHSLLPKRGGSVRKVPCHTKSRTASLRESPRISKISTTTPKKWSFRPGAFGERRRLVSVNREPERGSPLPGNDDRRWLGDLTAGRCSFSCFGNRAGELPRVRLEGSRMLALLPERRSARSLSPAQRGRGEGFPYRLSDSVVDIVGAVAF
jgi:hypothetical protein